MRMLTCLALAFCVIAGAACSDQTQVAGADGDILVIETKNGKVLIKLRPDLAPKHVERVKTLAKEGFYDGLKFHRVIGGFMAQTGDPSGTGSGGSNYPDLPAEFSQEPYKRGTVGAARTADPNSANSQFFICFDRQRLLEPHRPVHHLGRGHRGHGQRRQDRQGRAAGHPRRDGEGLPAGGRRSEGGAGVIDG